MKVKQQIVTVLGVAACVLLLAPVPAGALAISVPTSANLGSVPSGTSSLSQKLGTVTASDSGTLLLLPSFEATVSTTTFTTGSGSTSETIGKPSISYFSGPPTSTSGLQNPSPGQLTGANAQDLSTSRTAFSSNGLVLSISTSWNPTIVITIPPAAVAGTYTGTVTHSVA